MFFYVRGLLIHAKLRSDLKRWRVKVFNMDKMMVKSFRASSS